MPGQRGTERRQKRAQILVRFTPTAEAAVRQVAYRRGLSAAAWLRDLAVQHAGLSDAERRPRPPSVPVHVPPQDLATIAEVMHPLGEACGMATQFCKATRELGLADVHAEAERVLAAYQAAYGELKAAGELLRSRMLESLARERAERAAMMEAAD